ncbi:DUF3429 domain-containing protein [Vibrio hangzhouensis]|uniref:DUF3429 domain-containing protein n=1 Tax=Vibrio hangzhouensis TaxID=462991 RepID=UPI001C968270|nr:DUF3429 domain-containing protein [Vibrio hangzhouensis]MBY6198074.1 DUF3429 domain-containing protein [Vibrio hangzhouensis]
MDGVGQNRTEQLMAWLGYLGLLPFALCIVSFNPDAQIFGLNARLVFVAYSGIILSFLCGILWSHALSSRDHAMSFPLLLLSNLICLMGWLVILITPAQFQLALVVSLLGYGCVWMLERIKTNAMGDHFPKPYHTLRNHLTLGVAIAHIIALAGAS